MTTTIQVGGVRCHILSDGLNLADGGGFFGVVPRLLWQRVIEPDGQNLVPSDTRSLLIESDAGLILVDTGVGDKLTARQRQIVGLDDRRARLVNDLARVGYRPQDVDIVVLTHLHNDHTGGATRWDTPDGSPGPLAATFPNARYYVQRPELDDATHPNERTAATYFAENWDPLLASGRLELLDAPLQLGSQVRTEITPGHTAALQVVWVEDRGEALLFLGDACSWAAHLDRLAWVPAYDVFPMTSIETKRRLRQTALDKDALLVFQHDPQVVTGRLFEGTRGPEVQPIVTKGAWDDPLL
jgi:glyoxylase-like metal-dependent hydrolase (beta-lactamase superfamily II)